MEYAVLIIILAVLIILLAVYLMYYKKNRKTLKENISRIGQKNHDYMKIPHRDKSSALSEVRRMKSKNYPGSDRLNVYYNPERRMWFVGKSSLKKKTVRKI